LVSPCPSEIEVSGPTKGSFKVANRYIFRSADNPQELVLILALMLWFFFLGG
jgi:hypothetical protein